MRPQNSFLQFPQKILLFPKKLLNMNLIFDKKRLYSFSLPDAPFPPKKAWAPETIFAIFAENTAFFEKTPK